MQRSCEEEDKARREMGEERREKRLGLEGVEKNAGMEEEAGGQRCHVSFKAVELTLLAVAGTYLPVRPRRGRPNPLGAEARRCELAFWGP